MPCLGRRATHLLTCLCCLEEESFQSCSPPTGDHPWPEGGLPPVWEGGLRARRPADAAGRGAAAGGSAHPLPPPVQRVQAGLRHPAEGGGLVPLLLVGEQIW